MTPELNHKQIVTDIENILLDTDSVNYLRDALVGEHGKLVIACLSGELIIGVGPKEIPNRYEAPKINNHIDILYKAVRELFSKDREQRNNCLDLIVQDSDRIITGGCFIEFLADEIRLDGESNKFGRIPDGIFSESEDSKGVIQRIVADIRFNN